MSRSLRILLFAHHQVGMAVLQGLREAGHEICACFTHPTEAGWIPPVQDACDTVGIACRETVPTPSDASSFRDSRPDLIVSAGYRRRVSLPFLALPRWGSVNAHLGPLPGYRGASPIPWGIFHGESSWAVSIHAMTHNYNEGGILRERIVPLHDDDNAYDLLQRCGEVSAQAMVDTVNDIAAGGGDLVAQDLRAVRFFDGATPFGGRIDWNQPAERLAAFVRAMDMGRGDVEAKYQHLVPPAQAMINGQEIGIWRAHAGGTMSAFAPGTITRSEHQVWVQTVRGHLVLDRLCDANGHDFSAVEYVRAKGLAAQDSFDARYRWRATYSGHLSYAA